MHTTIIDKQEQLRYEQLYHLYANPTFPYAGNMLLHAAQRYPGRIALVQAEQKITYAQLLYHAQHITKAIQEKQLPAAAPVFIFIPNSFAFYQAYHGAWLAGMIVVPGNIFMQDAEKIHVIKDCNPALIITIQEHADSFKGLGIPLLIMQDFPIHIEEPIDDRKMITVDQLNTGTRNRNSEECAVILYTSGTTGLPKGVMLSSTMIYQNALQGIARLDPQPGDSVWCALPLFHSFMQNACIWSPCIYAATIIIVPKLSRTAIQESLLQKPTIIVAVPALWGLLCQMHRYGIDVSSARYLISGGDMLPAKIAQAVELLYGRRLSNGYGLSETSPYVALDLSETRLAANCIGKPMCNTEIRIIDEQGQQCGIGIPGSLLLRGPQIMMGYYNAPELTDTVIDTKGWFTTGDIAYQDKEGRIYICGRTKDIIIHKGINIYPAEIENQLLQHHAVTATAVIGIEDEYGESPIAYVQSKNKDTNILIKELLQHCRSHLAAYKIPRTIIVSDQLPVTSTGKINKRLLKELHTQTNKK